MAVMGERADGYLDNMEDACLEFEKWQADFQDAKDEQDLYWLYDLPIERIEAVIVRLVGILNNAKAAKQIMHNIWNRNQE